MQPTNADDVALRPGRVASAVPYRTLVLLFVASRAYLYAVAALALRFAQKGGHFVAPHSVLDWFFHWDALWYETVVTHGYFFSRIGEPTNVVFFPLFPMLVRAVSLNGLLDVRFCGYVVSLSALWIAVVLLWRLARREWNEDRVATFSVAFLLFGPVGFFLSTWYSESCFLALAIGCIAATRAERWWLAGTLGALAALTRFVGVILVLPLAWQLATTVWSGRSTLRRTVKFVPSILLPIAGFSLYCVWMWIRFDDALLYFHAQENWGRHFTWFWGLLASKGFSSLSVWYQGWFAGAVFAAFALLFAATLLRVPTTYTIFALALFFVYVSARSVESLPRYFTVVFPLYFAAALIATRWRVAGWALLVGSAATEAVSVALFVNGYWFT